MTASDGESRGGAYAAPCTALRSVRVRTGQAPPLTRMLSRLELALVGVGRERAVGAELGDRLRFPEHQLRHVLAHRGAELVAVAGAAARHPRVLHPRHRPEQVVAVGAVLVLADLG